MIARLTEELNRSRTSTEKEMTTLVREHDKEVIRLKDYYETKMAILQNNLSQYTHLTEELMNAKLKSKAIHKQGGPQNYHNSAQSSSGQHQQEKQPSVAEAQNMKGNGSVTPKSPGVVARRGLRASKKASSNSLQRPSMPRSQSANNIRSAAQQASKGYADLLERQKIMKQVKEAMEKVRGSGAQSRQSVKTTPSNKPPNRPEPKKTANSLSQSINKEPGMPPLLKNIKFGYSESPGPLNAHTNTTVTGSFGLEPLTMQTQQSIDSNAGNTNKALRDPEACAGGAGGKPPRPMRLSELAVLKMDSESDNILRGTEGETTSYKREERQRKRMQVIKGLQSELRNKNDYIQNLESKLYKVGKKIEQSGFKEAPKKREPLKAKTSTDERQQKLIDSSSRLYQNLQMLEKRFQELNFQRSSFSGRPNTIKSDVISTNSKRV